jgi:inhibitor of cysteine peptidase
MRVLTDEDDGSTVSLAPGDTVELVLDENATTGYLWTVDEWPGALEPDGDGCLPPDPIRPGAAGRHWFRFRAAGPTDGTIAAERRRPWEVAAPDATFSVHVVVRAEARR